MLHDCAWIWILFLSVPTKYLSSELSKRVRYRVEHEKINTIHIHKRACNVLFIVIYINILIITTFLTIFQGFPKIFKNSSEGLTSVSENFPNIFGRLPKIS